MPVVSGGQHESGLDRALDIAFDRSLDTILESGEMPSGPSAAASSARPVPRDVPKGRGWQVPLTQERPDVNRGSSLWDDVRAGLGLRPAAAASPGQDTASPGEDTASPAQAGAPEPAAGGDAEQTKPAISDASKPADDFHFIDERVGIVVIHGIGPQLAGQTLLDWTRPIIELVSDWREVHRAELVTPPNERFVNDPVLKANIDFSGETFPTVQVVVPGIRTADPDDPRSKPRRWVFTEAWWAQEVRPPTLATMIGWLGEQGGVGRIVSGIVENTFGGGRVAQLAEVSLRAFMSVIVSFVLLVFLVLLGLSKLIPFGPLRDAVVLRLASSFITDWFGGARTLLRDPAQSANVRGRLVTAIKAVRAYGCREVIVIAHSGGTMVSWMTLTDPAWPNLRIQKLITHGEALNLAWRLQAVNPDDPKHPQLPRGDRMTGNLADAQPDLLWRDFWATNDPAPSGRPIVPNGVDNGGGRFTEEKVWNRMSLGEDHGGYWDDDEHFLLPLVRELDVPSGDRGGSRFYDDTVEATLRNRRKQRVSLLALWRRVAFALPVMAVLAAATMTFPGAIPEAGDAVMTGVGSVPGHEVIDTAGRALAQLGDGQIAFGITWTNVYGWGRVVLQAIFLVLILVSLAPVRAGPQWEGHWKPRLTFTIVDIGVGLGLLGLLTLAWLLTFVTGVTDSTRVGSAVNDVLLRSGVLWTALLVFGVFALGSQGPAVRRAIRKLQGSHVPSERALRVLLVSASAVVLAAVLVGVVVASIGVVLVLAGNTVIDDSEATRKFALGVVLVLVAFNFMARLGTWRWGVWDRRERRLARRAPLVDPNRGWAFLQALLLSIPLVLGALVVSFGTPTWRIAGLDRGGMLTVIGVVLVLIGMISVARDVVESDTEGLERDGATGPVLPSQTPPAPGQSR
jgi:hypothetical protein